MILNYYNDLVYKPSEIFLNKDFGMVATVLGSIHDKSVIHLICCNERNGLLCQFSGNFVFQAKKNLRFLSSRLDIFKNFSAYWFLLRNRKSFNVLVMFPFCPPSDFLIAKLFLAFNPGAKIVLKLDANLNNLLLLQASYKAAPHSRLRQHFYYRGLLEMADIVIYETVDVGRLFSNDCFLGVDLSNKSLNIFNGLSENQVKNTVGVISPRNLRENVIIFSARLWAPEKNVELIFRSDPVPKGWKINFIGAMDKSFSRLIEKYRAKDPSFDEKYNFLGEIKDKKAYFHEISKGRVFLLCSNKEGFPLVYAEAHYFGLYIITTDVSGATEATCDGRYGKIIPVNDPVALRDVLLKVCNESFLSEVTRDAHNYGYGKFIWEHTLRAPEIEKIFLTHC
jgi:GalNAc-alpha-(1->4)-GalNAc-alpha-(1->3)-diNAcBac-PP-undecaprenol alpha-1,4-N-acetyl-D-galactosaminyltransferase